MEHILIVDDDRKIRELLQEYLRNQGLQADLAESAEKAHQLLMHHDYSLIVVDIMMPGETGIEFTKKVKHEKDIPILMLTAKGEIADRIEGLESGADDYLQKPFEPKELYLRIMKLVSRARTAKVHTNKNIVKFGEFEFNLESRSLTKGEERIFLSSTESELMHLFCSNINKPVERMELAEKFNGISERSVDVQITRLRKKIETDPKEPKFLQTSRGKGYVFRV
jgi:two-component system phosphate regulon response regulator OmpR